MNQYNPWFYIGLLPGQRALLRNERVSFFIHGTLTGIFVTLILAVVFVFGFFISEREKYLNDELTKKDKRIEKQKDEIGILNGVVFAAFGKSAPLVIEQFRLKERKK